MRAWQVRKYGSVSEVLKLADIPVPAVRENEVLVETHAVSVNPIDYKTVVGAREIRMFAKLEFPITIGIDLSGVVSKVGSGVTSLQPGDSVFAKMPETGGAFADFVVVHESWLAPKPISVSHEQAAALPLLALTSWQALVETAKVVSGQKVFVAGGSGGIGTFAIQLAKVLEAQVATTTSAANIELVQRLGADTVIDYKSQDFSELLAGY